MQMVNAHYPPLCDNLANPCKAGYDWAHLCQRAALFFGAKGMLFTKLQSDSFLKKTQFCGLLKSQWPIREIASPVRDDHASRYLHKQKPPS
jgi:hypothetical protein